MEQERRVAPGLDAVMAFLGEAAQRVHTDPLTNSVFALAQSMFLDLEEGHTSLEELGELIDRTHLELARDRAARLRDRHGYLSDPDPWICIREKLEAAASAGFESFSRYASQPLGGVVFTAHPTFAISPRLRAAIASQAQGPSALACEELAAAVSDDPCAWNSAITLEAEHEEVQRALANAATAQKRYAQLIYDVARQYFPASWRHIRAGLPTLASWVGYDLDGRTDISWSKSFSLRLSEKARQLAYYAGAVREIISESDPCGLVLLAEKLEVAAHAARRQSEAFSENLGDPQMLVAASYSLQDKSCLKDSSQILCALDEAIRLSADDDQAFDLLVLRAQAELLSLGTAHIHLRVNAAQISAVIEQELNLETDDQSSGRLALAALARRAASPDPVGSGLGDVFLEKSTARRQFMLCMQIFKHIDNSSPIRFLIAESENPATVMGALYLARHYKVEHQLDISPLFETPEALESGGRFIERLLDEEEFRKYLARRGYLSVQLGFSDSGRFIGQVAANMAVERIHNVILRALAERMPGIGLRLFNTHGESMGRGAWPGGIRQRFDHLLSPWTRMNAARLGVPVIHEVSFQGGDGYLHFAGPKLAESSLVHWCSHVLDDPEPQVRDDPFYTDTDLVWDFYRGLRRWHERLFANPDYERLLSDFSPGLIVVAGSRQNRRPEAGAGGGVRKLRAIPQNAQLQQMAIPLNTACGIGSALMRETERLADLVNRSRRMRNLLEAAWRARSLTSLPVLRSYGQVYDPDTWIAHARYPGGRSSERAGACRVVYAALRSGETTMCVSRSANILSTDLERFDALLEQLSDAPTARRRHQERATLHALHAIRQALMMRAFALVGRVPRISQRHGIDSAGIVRLVTALRIRECRDLLIQIFPAAGERDEGLSALVEARLGSAEARGYDHIHEEIIRPLTRIDSLLHRISLCLNHPYDACG